MLNFIIYTLTNFNENALNLSIVEFYQYDCSQWFARYFISDTKISIIVINKFSGTFANINSYGLFSDEK